MSTSLSKRHEGQAKTGTYHIRFSSSAEKVMCSVPSMHVGANMGVYHFAQMENMPPMSGYKRSAREKANALKIVILDFW